MPETNDSNASAAPDAGGATALVAVLAVAAGLRLAALFSLGDVATARGDETYYLSAALSLVRGEGYPGAVRPPGFPAFVAGVMLVAGERLTAVRLVQVASSLVAVALVFALVRPRFGIRAASLSALLCAVTPDLVHYTHFLWSENLVATLLLLLLWTLDRFDRAPRAGWLVAAGVVLGVSILTREMLLYFLPVAVLWIWWREPRALGLAARRALLVALPAAAIVLPWTARNHATQGRFVLVSTTRWLPIAQGNLLPESGSRFDLRASTTFGRRYTRIEDEQERERIARATALRAIREAQPWWILRKLERSAYFLFAPETQVGRFTRRGWFGERAQPLAELLVPLEAGLYVALMLAGIAAIWLVPGGRTKVLVVALLLLHLGIYTVANANHRFRVPLEPLLLLYGGPLLCGFARRPARARLAWAGAALCVAGFVAVVATHVAREGGLGVTRGQRRATSSEIR